MFENSGVQFSVWSVFDWAPLGFPVLETSIYPRASLIWHWSTSNKSLTWGSQFHHSQLSPLYESQHHWSFLDSSPPDWWWQQMIYDNCPSGLNSTRDSSPFLCVCIHQPCNCWTGTHQWLFLLKICGCNMTIGQECLEEPSFSLQNKRECK